ncbi:MAG: hypothetical protein Q4D45_11230 [Lachnospiraceae bacterium]|nr:hypothetical protein [Lachnospiraceae bacterium]
MKRMQKVLMVYGVVVTALCLYLACFSFSMISGSSANKSVNAEPIQIHSATESNSAQELYRLAVEDGQVVILKGQEIFETTGIDENDMNEDLKKEVENGVSFDSAEDVYSFLESCTS